MSSEDSDPGGQGAGCVVAARRSVLDQASRARQEEVTTELLDFIMGAQATGA